MDDACGALNFYEITTESGVFWVEADHATAATEKADAILGTGAESYEIRRSDIDPMRIAPFGVTRP